MKKKADYVTEQVAEEDNVTVTSAEGNRSAKIYGYAYESPEDGHR
jgi:hypothetical protein